MIDWQSAVIGGVAFLFGLYVLYRLVLLTTSLGDDEHDTESTGDRLAVDGTERHRRVGFRHRVSRQTPMTKAFLGAVIVLVLYLAIAMYQVAATGAPSEAVYADYVEYAVFGAVCVGGGVWFKAKQNAKAGELQIMLETEKGNQRQTVRFDRSKVRITEDGTKLLPQLKANPFLGLFWRPLLVADDPELRDSDHRLPDDLVLWEIPYEDDSAVWDERRGEVTVRAKDKNTIDNPNRVADYEIVPSDRKSKSELQALENEKSELEDELRAERIQVSILSEQLAEIENILTNEEDAGMRRLREAKDVLEPDRPSRSREYRHDDREADRQSASSD
ncbi:hypothetical protein CHINAEXTREME_20485 (plasmid) [Halobiforma lacisalsi AJ5]|uniref:Uncharacterized protein n=1 Tax=Natronobacterium lacisalsi AJ5 TaxID=358396 RepID=M0LV88_NATLA|nr:hypothetical protein [Halobiforma lacisalsi]APX00192.1 hypothetical protein CHINAEXTREME_20485 [Halobiforma lacisalsi AJ5]EMA37391.1 hypothetical protein C445_00841 [Halobiforma lacisalsi AJ5]